MTTRQDDLPIGASRGWNNIASTKHPVTRQCLLLLTALLILIIAAEISFTVLYAKNFSPLSSDEATSIVAARAILDFGLPYVPSEEIYYRSPLSHYLSAVSIALLGDNTIGWRGASLLAYALLLIIPAVTIARRSSVLFSLIWVVGIGANPALIEIAASARMYMVYTFFSTMTVMAGVFWSHLRFRSWVDALYVAAAVAAAFTHEYFVVLVPGLLIVAVIRFAVAYAGKEFGFWPFVFRFLKSPLFTAPTSGLTVALFMHFGDPYFPNSFANFSSSGVVMGEGLSFVYPLTVMGQGLIPPLLLVTGALALSLIFFGRLSATHSIYFCIIFSTAFFVTSITLPHSLTHYVIPIWPVFGLVVASLASAGKPTDQLPSTFAVASVVVLLGFGLSMTIVQPSWKSSLVSAVKTFTRLPESKTEQWGRLSEYVQRQEGMVITSNPEFLLLYHVGSIAAHVRTFGVEAASDCSTVIDDYSNVPFAHHTCQLDEIVETSENQNVPLVFVGNRLGHTVGPDNTAYIRSRFKQVGVINDQQVWCYGPDCGLLNLEQP